MNFLKRFFEFILFGNIYVAIGAACLVQSSVIQLGYTNHLFFYSLLVFFSTLFQYNFQRVFYKIQKDNSLNSIRRQWIFKNQKSIKLLMLTGFTGVVITFFFNSFYILFYFSPLLLLSLLYFLPFVKLRKNPWLKLLTLVLVWTMVTAVVPILLSSIEFFTKNIFLHILTRFCFMTAICIPFDIRDLQIDKTDAVSTIPHLMGENKARWLAFGFMLLYIVLIISEYAFGNINSKIFTTLIIYSVACSVLVLMSNSRRSEYFYIAGIDGTMVLQGVLLMGVYYL